MTQDNKFLGVVLVAREAAGQARAIFQYPSEGVGIPQSLFGIGSIEFGKFTMPAQWLINRKLDFEISVCGPSIASRMFNPTGATDVSGSHHLRNLRFVSFPYDFSVSKSPSSGSTSSAAIVTPNSIVTAFNIVFVFDSDKITDEEAELYWQALVTLSRAIISEEEREYYLSHQVAQLISYSTGLVSEDVIHALDLTSVLIQAYKGLGSFSTQAVALYVNNSILTHIGVIPFANAPSPPTGYQSLLLTMEADELQRSLPVDSTSNVRRLIDAADPSKTIKEHMVELGLPISAIQRISQHLVYWKKAKIVHPLNKRVVLAVNHQNTAFSDGVVPSDEILHAFSDRFKIPVSGSLPTLMKLIHLFSRGHKLHQIKDNLMEEIPQIHSKFNDLCFFLLSKSIVQYSLPFFRYFPPTSGPIPGSTSKYVRAMLRGPGGPNARSVMRPKFQSQLSPELRREFSPMEFDVIFDKLAHNQAAAELMIKLIANYVKRHKDLLTARIELNEQFRCTNEEFHQFTESLIWSNGVLSRYDCDGYTD